jgi:hypothetical protein
MSVIKFLLAWIISIFPLLVWRENYQYDCIMLAMPILVMSIITISIVQLKYRQRLCLANCYAQSNSILFYILTGRILVIIRAMFIAVILTIILMTQIALWRLEILMLLWLDGIVIYLIYKFVYNLLSGQVNLNMRNLIAKNWTITINSVLMLILLANIQFYTAIPAYLDESLTQTIINATNTINSECFYIQLFIQLTASYEASLWWLMVLGSQFVRYEVVLLSLWGLFLLGNGLALFAYSRYLISILIFHEEK